MNKIYDNGFILINISYSKINEIKNFFESKNLLKNKNNNHYLKINNKKYSIYLFNNEKEINDMIIFKEFNNKIIINADEISLLLIKNLFVENKFNININDNYYIFIENINDKQKFKKLENEYKNLINPLKNINIKFFNEKQKLLDSLWNINENLNNNLELNLEDYKNYKNVSKFNHKYSYFDKIELRDSLLLLKNKIKNKNKKSFSNDDNINKLKLDHDKCKKKFQNILIEYKKFIKNKIRYLVNDIFMESYCYNIYYEIQLIRFDYFNENKYFYMIKNNENINYLRKKENEILLKIICKKLNKINFDIKKSMINEIFDNFIKNFILKKNYREFEIFLNKLIDKKYMFIKTINENFLRKFEIKEKLKENWAFKFIFDILNIFKIYLKNNINYEIWKINKINLKVNLLDNIENLLTIKILRYNFKLYNKEEIFNLKYKIKENNKFKKLYYSIIYYYFRIFIFLFFILFIIIIFK